MRKLLSLLALVAGVSTLAAAQQSWQAEIGIQGGVFRLKPAGTSADDAVNFLQLPGGSFFNGLYGSPPLFAVIPWKNKMAVEAQFGLLQLTGTGATGHATVSPRSCASITPSPRSFTWRRVRRTAGSSLAAITTDSSAWLRQPDTGCA